MADDVDATDADGYRGAPGHGSDDSKMRFRMLRYARHALMAGALVGALSASVPPAPAQSAALPPQNLTRLVGDAELIVVAQVMRVTDGFTPQGEPYTEVTLGIDECPKGALRGGARHTFRQFGLVAPRKMPDGQMLLAVSPDGYPRWHEGERVVAFLEQPEPRTGLQTTVGLAHGKLNLLDGRAVNELGNRGLFDGVRIDGGLLTQRERAMIASRGPVDAATFVGLVARAARENWVATGKMR